MRLMSEQGLSSIAVTDAEGGGLLSAVSVTDIARVRIYPLFYAGKPPLSLHLTACGS